MHDETTRRLRPHVDRRPSPHAHAETWDDLYNRNGDGVPLWSGQPNGSLVAEVADLIPGTALDVGCGEGADAIWLAQRGWEVTALDPSAAALGRAAAAAVETEVTVAWRHGGLVETAAELGTFDLVSVQYGVLPLDTDATAVRLLCRTVAPGGTLLVIHHELDLAHDGYGLFDPADHLMPDDVAAHLGDEWQIETHERRQRPGTLPPGTRHVRDIVLRARRLEGSATA
jgi:2-polyprenyl-3-methyl-5-hydroxy-6-metoxy-1,4-benzoquinol methylase